MSRLPFLLRSSGIVTILALALSLFASSSVLAAPRDRQAPTKPTNLRVTALTAHNVTMAWNASTDNSGSFSYKVVASWGSTYTVPQTQTTFSVGLVPANTYTFYVYAEDGSGNKSARSNTLSVTTPPDTTAPTAPVLSLAGVNPTEASLQWTASTDDGLHLFYQVYVNSVANVDAGSTLNAVVNGLTPETTYDITVRARDLTGNLSEPSNVVSVTTAAVSETDTVAPSDPSNFFGYDVGGLEVNLFWTESFDNQTPQGSILYEIYMEGVLLDWTTADHATEYVTHTGDVEFSLIAVDGAGNRSQPVSIIVAVQ
jgi:chitodextrinase